MVRNRHAFDGNLFVFDQERILIKFGGFVEYDIVVLYMVLLVFKVTFKS